MSRHVPTESTQPLTKEGAYVPMTLRGHHDPVEAIGGRAYTENLTSCIAIATFCYHGHQPTLTHAQVPDESLGRLLADRGHVHNGDVIVIGLGSDAYISSDGTCPDFARTQGDLSQGLASSRRVDPRSIDWRYNAVGPRSDRDLDPYTFVVSGWLYGRAGKRPTLEHDKYYQSRYGAVYEGQQWQNGGGGAYAKPPAGGSSGGGKQASGGGGRGGGAAGGGAVMGAARGASAVTGAGRSGGAAAPRGASAGAAKTTVPAPKPGAGRAGRR